jgi:hypothetical protein
MNSGYAASKNLDASEPLFTSRISNGLAIGTGGVNGSMPRGQGQRLVFASLDSNSIGTGWSSTGAHRNQGHSTEGRANLGNNLDHLMVRLQNESRLRSQKYRQMQQCLDIEMDIDEQTDYLNSMKSREADLTENYLLEDDDGDEATHVHVQPPPPPPPIFHPGLHSGQTQPSTHHMNASQNMSNISQIHAGPASPSAFAPSPASSSIRARKQVLFFNDRAFVRDQSSTVGSDSCRSSRRQAQEPQVVSDASVSVSASPAYVSVGGGCSLGMDTQRQQAQARTSARSPTVPFAYKESIVDSTYLLGSDSEGEDANSSGIASARGQSHAPHHPAPPVPAADAHGGEDREDADASSSVSDVSVQSAHLRHQGGDRVSGRMQSHPAPPTPPAVPFCATDSFHRSSDGIAMGANAGTDSTHSSIEADTEELQKQLYAAAARQQQSSEKLKSLLQSLRRSEA